MFLASTALLEPSASLTTMDCTRRLAVIGPGVSGIELAPIPDTRYPWLIPGIGYILGIEWPMGHGYLCIWCWLNKAESRVGVRLYERTSCSLIVAGLSFESYNNANGKLKQTRMHGKRKGVVPVVWS